MDLLDNVNTEHLAQSQFRITWPGFRQAGEEEESKEEDDEEEKPTKKGRKKKRKKKKRPRPPPAPPPPPPCATCRLGPEGAARSNVRRAALWCCTRCCLMCCSALRVLIAVIGVAGICLAAFYILSPDDSKGDGGARVVRAGLRALGARPRTPPRARPRPPHVAPVPRDNSELDPLQTVTISTECGPECPGGGPDGSDCGAGCPGGGGRTACLGRKEKLAGDLDIEVIAGPFRVVDSSVIVSPHDSEADDQGDPDDGPSSPGDLGGRSSDVPNDPED